ncbi:single-stranded DNA-binding protein, putative (SSB) [Plasmodium ovale wallikeri]|uniref:Single-stranded DNA-binding protein, putative n=2 Tax=Plasmodium ovale TaxID=36330 RepID=A0A1C3KKV7_PLAOA|nr:single-stranded DNA-binding protein, putative (SSB) [Plasmodium ovale wallikeri]SBT36897.1 single-stranded DNA-binding protein, putative (SSB) [Plasmodium ovale wallikeri]SBT74617.1 single-stranded DNA-binding protein, putative [Plasmodium ovale]
MKFSLLATILYFNVLLRIWGYLGEVRVHHLNSILNKRIVKSRKISIIKNFSQNDYNYENKRFYNARAGASEKSLNRITLIGRVGCEPDIKILNGGDKVATFSLATNEFWRDRNTNELKSKTDWHRIVVYDQNIVDLIDKYLRKGRRVYIQGSLHTRRWFGNDLNNQPKQITEIVLSYNKGDLIFLDDKRNFISRNSSILQHNESQNMSTSVNQNAYINNDVTPTSPDSQDDRSDDSNNFSNNMEDTAENFEGVDTGLDKDEEGIYDKMNTQEFDE